MKPSTRPLNSAPLFPLCPYQQDWIADRARFKIAVKARRIGFTFASTLEIALDLVSRRTRWLIISRTQDSAREALKEVKNHFAAMRAALSGVEICEQPTGVFFEGLRVTQFVISLPNGSEVTAMTSHPDAARGFGGNVFLDEFAFHRDSYELWKGAAAAVLRGHRLIVVSTPHYQIGKFYELARTAGLTSGLPPLDLVATMSLSRAKPRGDLSHRGHVPPGTGSHGERISHRGHVLPGSGSVPDSQFSSSSVVSVPSVVKSPLWSPHWIDLATAAPQLQQIGVPIDLTELRELAGDEETWKQEFCCQFLSAAEMWIPLDLIAAARSSQATLNWDPSSVIPSDSEGSAPRSLYLGADIGRKRDRTAIWIDERIADVAICRGIIILDRTSFERQFEILSDLLAHPSIRRACIDQTGIGMALVERLQLAHVAKVEGVTFTNSLKEDLSLRVRRRMEERLDKIPENASAIERDFAAVKREITASGNLRFDAERTDAGHADVYWAKALADYAADSTRSGARLAACLSADPNPVRLSDTLFAPVPDNSAPIPELLIARPSRWSADRSPITQDLFA